MRLKPRESPFAPSIETSFSAASTFAGSVDFAAWTAAISRCVKSYGYIA